MMTIECLVWALFVAVVIEMLVLICALSGVYSWHGLKRKVRADFQRLRDALKE